METRLEANIRELTQYLDKPDASLSFYHVLLTRMWNEAVELGKKEANGLRPN